ncbi:hypothetical protein C8R42DRAFT_576418 [Lentinula raphanica]|nr:hypothetical protein C8R42DRAFT_576418 [Lentinula raphanica]
MGCGLIDLKKEDGKKSPGLSRLFHIIVSESMYLIWKLRNERVIGGKDAPSRIQILNKWDWTIRSRYELDRLTVSKKSGTKRLSKKVMRGTWNLVILDNDILPSKHRETGVLVSRRIDDDFEGE